MAQQDPYMATMKERQKELHREIAHLRKAQLSAVRGRLAGAAVVLLISSPVLFLMSSKIEDLNDQLSHAEDNMSALEAARKYNQEDLKGLREEILVAREKATAAEASAADFARRWKYAEQELIQCHDATDTAASALATCHEVAEASAYRCGWWKRDRDACYCSVSGDCDPVTVDWGGIQAAR